MIEWTDEAQATLEQLRTGTNDELIEQTRILAEQQAQSTTGTGTVDRDTVLDALAEAIQTRAFNSTYRAFECLTAPGVEFTPDQMALIKQYTEGGQPASAQRVILDHLAAQSKREPIPDLPLADAYARLMGKYAYVFEARRQRRDEQEDEAE